MIMEKSDTEEPEGLTPEVVEDVVSTNDEPVDEVSAIVVTDVVEDQIRAGIDAWIASHLRNSTFSVDTPAWNHFMDGLPALILGITKEVKQ
jgi:hypothetical protein